VDWLKLTGAKKVHSLVDKVYKKRNLELAWEKVRQNRGAGGIDGESIEVFEREAVGKLERLHDELKHDTYQPQPVRQKGIPKPGQPGKYRMLGIPTIYDRVCQQALLNRLEPIFEPVFDEANFGYRRGRSPKDALRKVWKELQEGYEWIVDADLRDFLETSSYCTPFHERLSKRVAWIPNALIYIPFRFPERTWTAVSSPRFTRCNTVWRETPRTLVASSIDT
jgi:retron-type reverse transcriptase